MSGDADEEDDDFASPPNQQQHIPVRISCPSIFFTDWLGGVGPRIFVYCVQHVLPGGIGITEGVHP